MAAPSKYGKKSHVVVLRPHDFRGFQALPSSFISALVYVISNGLENDRKRAGANWIISHYDVNDALPIGVKMALWESATSGKTWETLKSMTRAYLDHDLDMMRAKLAWHEDY